MTDTVDPRSQFAEYVARIIAGKECLTWARSRWHARTGRDIPFVETPLEVAFNEYKWNKKTFEANSIELSNLQALLRQSLEECDADALRNVIEKILRWGGVFRSGNRKWLDSIHREGLLFENITGALRELQSSPFTPVSFDAAGYRSNTGLSKVYSLALSDFAIFDSRVSAALQLMLWRFADRHDLPKIPAELFIHAMPHHGSVPRRAVYRGCPFPEMRNKTAAHVRSNRISNHVLSKAIAIARHAEGAEWCVRHPDALRRVEAALFMVGYHLPPNIAYNFEARRQSR